MNYFLAKTEPSTFSIDDFEKEGVTLWDGVHNFQAINVIKEMKVGDRVYIYHSITGKNIVGESEVVGEPFENKADPRKSWAIKLKFLRKFDGPTLADFKAEPTCKDFKLVTHSRLSVMPVSVNALRYIQQR